MGYNPPPFFRKQSEYLGTTLVCADPQSLGVKGVSLVFWKIHRLRAEPMHSALRFGSADLPGASAGRLGPPQPADGLQRRRAAARVGRCGSRLWGGGGGVGLGCKVGSREESGVVGALVRVRVLAWVPPIRVWAVKSISMHQPRTATQQIICQK